METPPPQNLETPKIWRPPKKLETPPKNWRPPPKKLETLPNLETPPEKLETHPLPREQNHTRLWKYNLARTSLRAVKIHNIQKKTNSPCQLIALRNKPSAYQFYTKLFHNVQSPRNRMSEYPLEVDKAGQDFMMFSVFNLVHMRAKSS